MATSSRIASVYVIGTETPPFKIGWAVDVPARLKALQAGHHQPFIAHFRLDMPTPVVTKVESYAHFLLREFRGHGEWFMVSLEEAIGAVREAAEAVERGERAPAGFSHRPGRPRKVAATTDVVKPFQIKLTETERERLEQHRAALGLRSHADVIRSWVAKPIEERSGQAA